MNDTIAVQSVLEKCIIQLVKEFSEEPFAFFNEAEAVTRFYQLLIEEPIFNRNIQTQDEHEVSRIHQDYPLKGIGYYDTVILNPKYIMTNPVDVVAKKGPNCEPDENTKPFLAIVELKLFYETLGKGRADAVIKDIDKLDSGAKYSEFAYLVYLQRYLKKSLNLWNKNWPRIREETEKKEKVGSIVAIYWREYPERQNLYKFGRWLQN